MLKVWLSSVQKGIPNWSVADKIIIIGGGIMPGRDGTGPAGGSSPGGGRRGGRCGGVGASGNCVCPGCGTKVPHQAGVPCFSVKCPTCGNSMVKEIK